MTNVLLINGGKREPVRILESDPSVNLLVLTEPRYRHLYGPATDVMLVDDIADFTKARDVVLRDQRKRPVDYIVAPTERSQPVAGYLRDYFGLPGTSFDIAHRHTHKYAMKRRLRAAGLSVAEHRLVLSVDRLMPVADELSWPVVVKPVLGAGSASTYVVSNPARMLQFLATEEAYRLRQGGQALMVEEFVDMTAEYHCDGIVVDSKVRYSLASQYFEPLLYCLDTISGSISLAPDDPDQVQIQRIHERVVESLGLRDGVTHLELFKTKQGFLVGEIACRPGGAGIPGHIRHHSGLDIWTEFINIAIGRSGPISARTDASVVMNVQLPTKPGKVTGITPAHTFMEIPDVVEAQINARVGDTLGDEIHSSAYVGLLFLRTRDVASAWNRLDTIADVNKLTTERVSA
ncbi:MAG TPA: ATP-grasp domain-containing protein [Candidatus Stackebrandtia faecavium]|nr:ATP-grasp domain-containing protein [Candidatus Stackebrandtia faecavium]